ncbi:FAD-dependent oxidoreductase [Candidatus Micrarchaeota archaeon]|nr:FAD-dependent oxidoreductase [Candidatus Micrarchaeota archaeon]
MNVDVLVVGAGPAGLTAGIYCVRRGLSALVCEGKIPGGTVAITPWVENYPGFKRISGVELAQKIEEHAREQKVELKQDAVVSVEKKGVLFEATLAGGEKVSSKAVILAMGAMHKSLGVKGEKELSGRGVSYCATCDAPLFKKKRVAVIGGGNTALSSALLLLSLASKTFLVHRREEFRGEEAMLKQAEQAGVEKIVPFIPLEILGKSKVSGLKVQHAKTLEEKTLELDGVFICVGEVPASELAKKIGVTIDKDGYIQVDKECRTSVEGVYAAGDITGWLKQIVTAEYMGAQAAISAFEFIKKEKVKGIIH